MRSKTLTWLFALLACAAVVGGIAFLWKWKGASLGISIGLPAGVTLVTSILAWAQDARPATEQTATSNETERSRHALADRTIERLRNGLGSLALPPSFLTLEARWAASAPGAVDDTVRDGTDDVTAIAGRLRTAGQRRLVILGGPGCGKTTLARLLMAELIEHARDGDPVPVLLDLATWDVSECSLREWMHLRIRAMAPELRSRSGYGRAIVTSLIRQGMILPVFDGLDVLPEPARRAVLTSDEFLLPARVVLTSRTEEFRQAAQSCGIADAIALTPGRVGREAAETFLRRTTAEPKRWDEVFRHIAEHPQDPLASALARPRIVCLAGTVYRSAGRDPAELIDSQLPVEDQLLGTLLEARLAPGDTWGSCPWYRERARDWLTYLAWHVRDPETGELAWGSVFRVVPRFYHWQALVRAVTCALLAWLVVALVYTGRHGPDRYGVLTGLAYAFAIGSACLFLTPHKADRVKTDSQSFPALRRIRRFLAGLRPDDAPPDFRPPAAWWWVRNVWRNWWRVIGASAVAFVLYGTTLGIRTAILRGQNPPLEGFSEGLIAALVVGLGALIAGLPSPPRSGPEAERPALLGRRTSYSGVNRLSKAMSIGVALSLGVLLGLVAAVLALTKHHAVPPLGPHASAAAIRHHVAAELKQAAIGLSVGRAVSYGLVMGLNFGVGAWLVSWTRMWLTRDRMAGPGQALRAERRFTVLAALILGLTFASAFGLSANLRWTHSGAIANGLIGVIVGSLVSEWPLYVVAVTIVALRNRQHMPCRLMKFLGLCGQIGLLRPVRAAYTFTESPAKLHLTEIEPAVAGEFARQPIAGNPVVEAAVVEIPVAETP